MRRHDLLATFTLVLGACSSAEPRERTSGRLAVSVAPLSLSGVDEACYGLTIYNESDELVARLEGLCTSRYGFEGDLSYVAPCDASLPASDIDGIATNRVELVLESLSSGGTELGQDAYRNPTRDPQTGAVRPAVLDAACRPNADTPVVFDLVVLRSANQGFFDIAVELRDVFCSAKLDCNEADGSPIELLHRGTERDATAVIALACVGGPEDTVLHMSDVVIACNESTFTFDPSSGSGGNVELPAELEALLFSAAVYEGASQRGGTGLAEAYWNIALGLREEALGGLSGCRLQLSATVSEDPWEDGEIPATYTLYPVLVYDAPLGVDGNGELVCGRHAVNVPGSAVQTDYASPSGGDVFCSDLVPGRAELTARLPVCAGPSFRVVVRTLDGERVSGATVSTPTGLSAVTNSNGIALLPPIGATTLAIEKAGFATTWADAVPDAEGGGRLEVVMTPLIPLSFDASVPAVLGDDGIAIEIGASSLVLESSGQPYEGEAVAELRRVAPDALGGALPGDLRAIGSGVSPLVFFEVTLTTITGEPLQPAPNTTVTVRVPLSTDESAGLEPGQAIPFFTFTANGWEADGYGIVTEELGGLVLVYEAVHFTWYGGFGELPSPCASLPDGAPCEDGDACTAGDMCSQGACVPGVSATTVCAAHWDEQAFNMTTWPMNAVMGTALITVKLPDLPIGSIGVKTDLGRLGQAGQDPMGFRVQLEAWNCQGQWLPHGSYRAFSCAWIPVPGFEYARPGNQYQIAQVIDLPDTLSDQTRALRFTVWREDYAGGPPPFATFHASVGVFNDATTSARHTGDAFSTSLLLGDLDLDGLVSGALGVNDRTGWIFEQLPIGAALSYQCRADEGLEVRVDSNLAVIGEEALATCDGRPQPLTGFTPTRLLVTTASGAIGRQRFDLAVGRSQGAGPKPTLEVVVEDDAAAALAGVRLQGVGVSALTGADGRAVFEVPSPGPMVLTASRDGYATTHFTIEVRADGPNGVALRLPIRRPLGLVTGATATLIDPMSGVEVTVEPGDFPPGNGPIEVSIVTRSETESFPFGTVLQDGTSFGPGFGLELTFTRLGVPLQVLDGQTVGVSVPVEADAPDGAAIPLLWLDPSTGLWREQAAGEVELSGGLPVLRAELPHFSWWMVPSEGWRPVWRDTPGCTRLTLRDPQTLAVTAPAGIQVQQDVGRLRQFVSLDAGGCLETIAGRSVTLTVLTDPPVTTSFVADDGLGLPWECSAERCQNIDLVLGATGGVISGTLAVSDPLDGSELALGEEVVTLQSGGPGAWVSVATTSTGADGTYRFDDLPLGTYRVVPARTSWVHPSLGTLAVRADAAASGEVAVSPGRYARLDHTLRLETVVAVELRWFRWDTTAASLIPDGPVGGHTFCLEHADGQRVRRQTGVDGNGQPTFGEVCAPTDAHGRVRFTAVPEGEVLCVRRTTLTGHIQDVGSHHQCSATALGSGRSFQTDSTLGLERHAYTDFTVIRSGAPLAGVPVEVLDVNGLPLAASTSSASGKAGPSYKAQLADLRVICPYAAPSPGVRVTGRAGITESASFECPPLANLVVRVEADSQPRAGVLVVLSRAASVGNYPAVYRAALTNNDGEVDFGGMPPGAVTLSWGGAMTRGLMPKDADDARSVTHTLVSGVTSTRLFELVSGGQVEPMLSIGIQFQKMGPAASVGASPVPVDGVNGVPVELYYGTSFVAANRVEIGVTGDVSATLSPLVEGFASDGFVGFYDLPPGPYRVTYSRQADSPMARFSPLAGSGTTQAFEVASSGPPVTRALQFYPELVISGSFRGWRAPGGDPDQREVLDVVPGATLSWCYVSETPDRISGFAWDPGLAQYLTRVSTSYCMDTAVGSDGTFRFEKHGWRAEQLAGWGHWPARWLELRLKSVTGGHGTYNSAWGELLRDPLLRIDLSDPDSVPVEFEEISISDALGLYQPSTVGGAFDPGGSDRSKIKISMWLADDPQRTVKQTAIPVPDPNDSSVFRYILQGRPGAHVVRLECEHAAPAEYQVTLLLGDGVDLPLACPDRVDHEVVVLGHPTGEQPGVPGARVTLTHDLFPTLVAVASTDAHGRARFAGLFPGPYRLALDLTTTAYTGAGPSDPVEVDADHLVTTVRVTPPLNSARVHGCLSDGAGTPLGNTYVTARATDTSALPPFVGVLTGPDGCYDFDGLAPGAYVLEHGGPGLDGYEPQFGSESGQEVVLFGLVPRELDFLFDYTGVPGALSYELVIETSASGEVYGIPGMVVVLEGLSGAAAFTFETRVDTGSGMDFQFYGLPNGRYRLSYDRAQPALAALQDGFFDQDQQEWNFDPQPSFFTFSIPEDLGGRTVRSFQSLTYVSGELTSYLPAEDDLNGLTWLPVTGGLGGVSVRLYDPLDPDLTTLATATTAPDGTFTFAPLWGAPHLCVEVDEEGTGASVVVEPGSPYQQVFPRTCRADHLTQSYLDGQPGGVWHAGAQNRFGVGAGGPRDFYVWLDQLDDTVFGAILAAPNPLWVMPPLASSAPMPVGLFDHRGQLLRQYTAPAYGGIIELGQWPGMGEAGPSGFHLVRVECTPGVFQDAIFRLGTEFAPRPLVSCDEPRGGPETSQWAFEVRHLGALVEVSLTHMPTGETFERGSSGTRLDRIPNPDHPLGYDDVVWVDLITFAGLDAGTYEVTISLDGVPWHTYTATLGAETLELQSWDTTGQ